MVIACDVLILKAYSDEFTALPLVLISYLATCWIDGSLHPSPQGLITINVEDN